MSKLKKILIFGFFFSLMGGEMFVDIYAHWFNSDNSNEYLLELLETESEDNESEQDKEKKEKKEKELFSEFTLNEDSDSFKSLVIHQYKMLFKTSKGYFDIIPEPPKV